MKFKLVIPLISVSLGIALWELVARTGLTNPLLFPPPSEIAETILDISGITDSKGLGYPLTSHLLHSFYRLLVGVALAQVVGVIIGIAMGMNNVVRIILQPLISIGISVPMLAVIPLLMLFTGLGDRTAITVTFLGALFPMIYNSFIGIRNIDKKQIWAAEIAGASSLDLFFRVMVPGAMGYIITGARIGVGRGWRYLVAAEMLAGTTWGLGLLLIDARQYSRPDVLFGGIVLLSALGLLIERGILGAFERRTLDRWGFYIEK